MAAAPAAIRQLGYVVRDLDEAIAHWLEHTAAGPFVLMPEQRFADWTYCGQPQDLVLDIAFGQLGDMMLELIRPHGPWPNVYGAQPPEQACQLHHFGFLVRDVDEAASALGAPLVTTARIDETAELRYFDCSDRFGVHFELITDTPSVRAFFELSEGLTGAWDGVSAPVRRLDEVTA